MTRMKRGPYRRKEPRQATLPGTQDPRNARLEAAGRRYVELCHERKALQKREAEALGTVLARLEQSGKPAYACHGFTITKVDGTPRIKVQLPGNGRDAGDDTEAAEAQDSLNGVAVD